MRVSYPEIIILVGSVRSGTTYLTWNLRKGLEIGFPAEVKFIVPFYQKLGKYGDLSETANLRRLVEEIHESGVFRHLHRVRGESSHPDEILERICEPTYTAVLYAALGVLSDKWGYSKLGYKNPADVYHMPLLARLLPTARFIHLIRDGRDVAASLLKEPWGASNMYCAAHYWADAVSRGRQDGMRLGDRYTEVLFEDLMLDTDRTATHIFDFVNTESEAKHARDFVNFINRTKKVDAVHRWKRGMDAKQRYICEAAAGAMLQSCGYHLEYNGEARLPAWQIGYYRGRDAVVRAKNSLLRAVQSKLKVRAVS